MQVRRFSGDVALASQRELKQMRDNVPRRRGAPTNGLPTPHATRRGALPGEHPEPGGSLRAKPAPNLDTDNHQAAAASAHELGVGLHGGVPIDVKFRFGRFLTTKRHKSLVSSGSSRVVTGILLRDLGDKARTMQPCALNATEHSFLGMS